MKKLVILLLLPFAAKAQTKDTVLLKTMCEGTGYHFRTFTDSPTHSIGRIRKWDNVKGCTVIKFYEIQGKRVDEKTFFKRFPKERSPSK